MSKIAKILAYMDKNKRYEYALENRKLKITYQYGIFEDYLQMELILSHSYLCYTGDVHIYDSVKHSCIFSDQFRCDTEEAVVNVLKELEHFGTRIREFESSLKRELKSAVKI